MSYPYLTPPAGSVLYIPFATYAGATGASVTLTGLAITDIEIYRNGSVTQRSSDAGYVLLDTDGIDFDGITGIHGFSIDLADNTDAGFYVVGSTYWIVVSAVTVDTQTVNFIAAVFRIVAAETIAGTPKTDVAAWLGTAAATPTVNGVPEVDVTHWIGTAAATPTVAGVPEVDVTHWLGTAAATPTVAGVPEVDVTHWRGGAVPAVATTGVPSVNAIEVGGQSQSAADLATQIALNFAAIGTLPTAIQNADALLDRANAIETGLTVRQAHRLEAAAAAGVLSGAATTTVVIRNAVANSKDRITGTVDASGNRSAVVTDVT